MSEQAVAGDWRESALSFIARARQQHAFAGFLARVNGEPAGGAWCQGIERVSLAFLTSDAPQVGYIWGVYVIPSARAWCGPA